MVCSISSENDDTRFLLDVSVLLLSIIANSVFFYWKQKLLFSVIANLTFVYWKQYICHNKNFTDHKTWFYSVAKRLFNWLIYFWTMVLLKPMSLTETADIRASGGDADVQTWSIEASLKVKGQEKRGATG